MARHYATRDFFRQMPNPLLARYFHARGVFDDLDIAALPEPQPDALWAAALVPANKKKDPRYTGIYRDMPGYSGMRPAVRPTVHLSHLSEKTRRTVSTMTGRCMSPLSSRYTLSMTRCSRPWSGVSRRSRI